MNSKHHALTLGPIIKTLSEARVTRELWAASYMFSYISKEIVKVLINRGVNEDDFLVPTIATPLQTILGENRGELVGIGLFPDRIIFKSPEEIDLKSIAETVIKQFVEKVANAIGTSKDDVSDYLLKYIQCYTLQMDIPDGKNASAAISPYLDSMELQRSFTQVDKDFLSAFFNRVTRSFLVQDAWKEQQNKENFHSFKTLLEIAFEQFKEEEEYKAITRTRRQNYVNDWVWKKLKEEDDKLDKNLLDTLILKYKKHEKTPLKQAHNYIAVVQADGDNVGSIIGHFEGEAYRNDYKTFSDKINEVNADAAKKIKDYGGMNIYAGGDDLLFFAPVVNGDTHIFDLLRDINKTFDDAFEPMGEFTVNGKPRKPSLSFGVSITYYKFPLYEALESAQDLLFEKAKTGDKNKLALTIQKHSGESFESVFGLGSPSYVCLQELMKHCLQNPNNKLSSIVFKIRENEELFKVIGASKTQVKNFIENSFNEPVHDEPGKRDYLNIIIELIPQVFAEKSDPDDALQTIYGMIRTVSFLISTEIKL